jgi:type II secretory pathway predicted ATPase ExeA
MYLEYWELDKLPFENVPDPGFMYYSPMHSEALTRMLYVAQSRKGAGMLTGEVGCGKTTVSRAFAEQLPSDDFEIALVTNPSMSPTALLREIAYQLGHEISTDSKIDSLHALNDAMIENVNQDKDTVIVIDEAHLIKYPEMYEELRLLLNFQLNDRFLLTLILLGQPELKKVIRSIPQFEQRIAIKYHLDPFDFFETVKYITFRLKKAGGTKGIFTHAAVEDIFEYSEGVPRKIHNICDLGLLVGAGKKAPVVDSRIISELIEEQRL